MRHNGPGVSALSSRSPDEPAPSQTLALYFEPERNVLPRAGEIDVAALRQVIVMMAEAGAIASPLPDATRFVDLQYLQGAGIQ